MAKLFKKLWRTTVAAAVFAFTGGVIAEDINISNFVGPPAGVEEQVYLIQEAWDGTFCDDFGCFPDSGDEEFVGTVVPLAETVTLGGEVVNVNQRGLEKDYYRVDGSGFKRFGWHDKESVIDPGEEDEAGRVYGLVSPPGDLSTLTETDLLSLFSPSNLTTLIQVPGTVTLGNSYTVNGVEFMGLDQVEDIDLTDPSVQDSIEEFFVFSETVTFGANRIDLTADLTTLQTDEDLAEFLSDLENLEVFQGLLAGYSDTTFLSNVVKVVVEGTGNTFYGGQFEGDEVYHEVFFLAEGIGIVMHFGEEMSFATGADTETATPLEMESWQEFLFGFTVNSNVNHHSLLAFRNLTVSSADSANLEDAVAAYCAMSGGNDFGGDPTGGDPTFDSGGDPTFDGGGDPTFDGGGDPTFDSGGDPTLDGGGDPTFDSGGDPTFDGGGDPTFDSGGDPTFDGGGDPTFDSGGDPSIGGDPIGGDPMGGEPMDGGNDSEWCAFGSQLSVNAPSTTLTIYYLNVDDFAAQPGMMFASSQRYVPFESDFLNSLDEAPTAVVLEQALIVTGTITDGDGAPAAGVDVGFIPVDGVDEFGNPLQDWSNSRYTRTGDDGTYTIYLSEGTFSVEANFYEDGFFARGWIGEDFVIADVWPPATHDIVSSTTLDGQFDQPLGSDSTISGTIRDSSGNGVQAEVMIRTQDWRLSFWAATDASGVFSVGVIQGERYVVEVWPSWESGPEFNGGNYIVNPDSPLFANNTDIYNVFLASEVDANTCYAITEPDLCTAIGTGWVPGLILGVWDEQQLTYIDMDVETLDIGPIIDLGTPLEGRIADDQGNGIANAWINGGFSGTSSDENGYFTLRIPSTAMEPDFQVDVWPGWNPNTQMQDTSFVGGVVTQNQDLSYSITGDWGRAARFVSDGSDWPAQDLGNSDTGLNIVVAAAMTIDGVINFNSISTDSWVNAWSPDLGFGTGAPVNNDGSFSMPVQSPESGQSITYEVSVWASEALSPEPVWVVVDENGVVSVDDDPTVTTVTFDLSQGTQISGRVVNENGTGQPWAWVEFKSTALDEFGFPRYWAGSGTDQNGNYVANVDPDGGAYIAVVYGWSGDFATNFYNGTPDGTSSENEATPVDVSSGSVEGINFNLSRGTTLTGNLQFSPALPNNQEAWINVYSESTNTWSGTWIRGDGSTTDFTFEIVGLSSATDYRLDVWQQNYISGFYGGNFDGSYTTPVNWDQATFINATDGNVADVNMTMSSGSSLTVVVSGSPQMTEGDWVDANIWSDSVMNGAWGSAQVDANGDATIVISGADPSIGANYRMFINTFNGGYINGFYSGDLSSPGTVTNWDQATLFDVDTDLTVPVVLGSGGSISGTISGLPAGARAWMDAWSENTGSWGGTEVVGTGSDVDFTITGLAAARDFRVGIWADGLQSGFWGGESITAVTNWNDAGLADLTTNSDLTGVNITLSAGNSITGTVSGFDSGLQRNFGWVDAWSNTTFSWAGTGVSEDEADYSLGGLSAASDYQVNLWMEAYTNQQAEADVSAGDAVVDFTLSTGGSISGSISGLNAFQHVWIDAWGTGDTLGWGSGNAKADANGDLTYTIEGLGAGDYVVGFWTPQGSYYYNDTSTVALWDQATPVTVTGDDDTSGVDITLGALESFSLTGTISGISETDLRAKINVWSDNGAWGEARRRGNGTYTIEGLPPGIYRAEAFAAGYVEMRLGLPNVTVESGVANGETWTSSWEWDDLGTITLAEDTSEFDAEFVTGLSISGTVVDQDSNALPYIWVNANGTSGFSRGAMSNANGVFTINEVEPNQDYTLDAWTPSGEAIESVSVATDNVDNVTLTVTQQEGSIGGTITVGGLAAEGILVYIYDASSGDFIAAAATASDGSYSVSGLQPDASYRVDVFDADALDAQTPAETATVTATSEGATQDFSL